MTSANIELCRLWASGEPVDNEMRDRYYARHPSRLGVTENERATFVAFRDASIRRYEVITSRNAIFEILSWPFSQYETNEQMLARAREHTTNGYLNFHATYQVVGTHTGECYRDTPHRTSGRNYYEDLFFHQILNGQLPRPASAEYPELICHNCLSMFCSTCDRRLDSFEAPEDRQSLVMSGSCLAHTPFSMLTIRPRDPKFKGIYGKVDVLRKTLKVTDASLTASNL